MSHNEFELSSQLDQLAEASKLLRAHCADLPIPPEDVDRLDLAMTEALTNVIEHAYGFEEHHPIFVKFTNGERDLVVSISDHGLSLPPEKSMFSSPIIDDLPSDDLADLQEGGWGLMIILSICEHVEYHSVGGRNTLSLKFNYPSSDISK